MEVIEVVDAGSQPRVVEVVVEGPVGPAGPRGVEGGKGEAGEKGDTGSMGPQGPIGATGAEGPKGDTGDTGAKGDTGQPGIQGLQGIQGAKGDTGAKGDQGVQGIQGVRGDQGEQGPQGEVGPTGETGPQGVQGEQGAGLKILGSLPDEESLPVSGALGDGYVIAGNLFVWNGTSWEDAGHIQGPPGESGPPGEDGPEGASTYAVAVAAGFEGDVAAWLASLVGPQGPVGEQGAQGEKGNQGPKGDAGDIGPKGETGDQGGPGEVGPKGDKGDTGDVGPKGDKGDGGDPGADGAAGPGVPTGGVPGQLLAKVDGTDYSTQWVTRKADPGGDVVGTTDEQTLTNKTLGNYTETVFAIADVVAVSLDPANGPVQMWTLGASRFPSADSFANGQSMTLMINDGSAHAIVWPSVTWVGGSAPALATSGYTVVELWKVAGTLYGALVGEVA